MTYNESVDIINSLLVFGTKPGLERISELVERIGSPDKKLKFVHIAGTNGKGSASALIANTLTCAGYKTGLFISPYVLEFRERFQINGQMIPQEDLISAVERIYPVVLEMKNEGKIITEFEFVFAIALLWYAEQECDLVVLETGLGGRFDATNIIDTPLVSLIMSISLDHTKILGDTVEKIAFEKCGIIKPNGVTVAYADQPDSVLELIHNIAMEQHNVFFVADTNAIANVHSDLSGSQFTFDGLEVHTPFIGEHQIKNAAAVLYTLGALRQQGISISDEAIQKGFDTAFFPARLEMMNTSPIVLLDGAHNPGGAKALSDAIEQNLSDIRKIAIVGMLADKDVHTALSMLIPYFEEVITVQPHNPRAMTAEQLAEKVRGFGVKVQPMDDYASAYRLALSKLNENDALIIFGSLYLASDMRKCIVDSTKE